MTKTVHSNKQQDRMSIDAIEEKTQRTQLTVLVLMIFIYLIGADN